MCIPWTGNRLQSMQLWGCGFQVLAFGLEGILAFKFELKVKNLSPTYKKAKAVENQALLNPYFVC